MAMRCPNCSNEISLEETFCGQCGTPVILSAKPVDPANRQGLLSNGFYNVTSPPSNNQPPMLSSGSQLQNGFYQDPTQTMPVLPSNKAQLSHQNATATSIPTPTTAPSPSPTAAASPSPTPSPTLTPTPTPDAGFALCDTTCTSNGFSVEYPGSWVQKPTNDSTVMQF